MPQDLETVLRRSPLSDAQRADLWDAYEGAPDADALAAALEPLKVPTQVKADLWDLKAQPSAVETPATQPKATPERTWGDTAQDLVIGAGKGLANTAIGLGEYVGAPVLRQIPGVRDYVATPEQFDEARAAVAPTNAPQKVGQFIEQVGEFFTPSGVAGATAKIKKAVDIGKTALLTQAQTGSPLAAGVSAGLAAVVPGAAGVQRAAAKLERSAQQNMAQALGATKEWAKAEAAKLAPEMLRRGVGGSREAMLGHAKNAAARVGKELNDAYKLAADAGEAVSGDVIRGNVQLARDALMVKASSGARIAIPGTERVTQQLDELDKFIETLGAEIPVDKAAHIKRTWDHIVSKAGLFGQKAGASATDSADAWALREASGAFRQLLNTNPSIEALNREVGFWTGLKKVLAETEKRTQAQSGGIVAAGTGGAGAIVGAMSGDSMSDRAMNAFLGGLAGRQFVKLVQSPAWRTQVSAPLKHKLADALASGSTGRMVSATSEILKALPAQMRPALVQ